jgi:hypothetical protein
MIVGVRSHDASSSETAGTGALRRVARKSRVARSVYHASCRAARAALDQLVLVRLRFSRRRLAPTADPCGVIVSLTSYPARIAHAWIAIETMLRQDQPPDRIVLVLADEEFPARTVPRSLQRQQRRGLEILWTPRNGRSHDKLVPTRLAHPDATIITIDDDAAYKPWVVGRLTARARELPGAVLGHRGWTITCRDDALLPYRTWERASAATPASRVFLTGVGGTLYPPGSLPIDLLADTDLAQRLCPTADDVWFWALARVAGSPTHCLGLDSHRLRPEQARSPQLSTINRDQGQNDVQLARVIEHFGSLLSPRGDDVSRRRAAPRASSSSPSS